MKKIEAEKLAIKLGLSTWYQGEDSFGGENVADEKAVKILMGYVSAPPNCPECGKQTESAYACHNNNCLQSNADRAEVAK